MYVVFFTGLILALDLCQCRSHTSNLFCQEEALHWNIHDLKWESVCYSLLHGFFIPTWISLQSYILLLNWLQTLTAILDTNALYLKYKQSHSLLTSPSLHYRLSRKFPLQNPELIQSLHFIFHRCPAWCFCFAVCWNSTFQRKCSYYSCITVKC